jgi:long-subunit fatty acid transport protein
MFTHTIDGIMRFSLVLLAVSTPAYAGGLTLPVQGVRGLERAGALVAGADDADALWLNPAGIAHAAGEGHQALLFDVAYVYQPVDYTSGGVLARNQQPGSPAPQLAGAYGVTDQLVLAAGISTPYMAFHDYDVTGPARYASQSLAGTNLVRVTFGAGYVVSPRLRIGATVQDHVTILDHKLVASACPGAMTSCDRRYDMPLEVQESDYFSPSGSLGVQWDASDAVTIGVMAQAPAKVAANGSLKVTPPPALATAPVTGDGVRESFWLPPSVRGGIEWHTDALRVEAALDVELWSLHDEIRIAPDHVSLGAMQLQQMSIPRHFETTYAPSLGVEAHLGTVQVGAGISYETAAAPPAYVSVLGLDTRKVIVGIGGGYLYGGWQVGVAAGFAHQPDVTVTDGKVPVLEPLHDPGMAPVANNGSYHASYWLAGLRLARSL